MRTLAGKLAIAVAGVTLLCWLVPGLTPWVGLHPDAVFERFALWEPFSYAFLAGQRGDVLGLLFGGMIIWSIGGALERQWGPRRMLTFSLGVTVLAGLLTLGAAALVPHLRGILVPGTWVLTTALWVAYGLYIGQGQANFWGIPTTGNVLALIGGAFVVIALLLGSPQGIPALFGLLLTVAYMRGANPRVAWLRFQSWRLGRQHRSRSKHLRVIGGKDANSSSSGSDRFLH